MNSGVTLNIDCCQVFAYHICLPCLICFWLCQHTPKYSETHLFDDLQGKRELSSRYDSFLTKHPVANIVMKL